MQFRIFLKFMEVVLYRLFAGTEGSGGRYGVIVANRSRAGECRLQRLHQGVRAQSQAQAQLVARLRARLTPPELASLRPSSSDITRLR
jgi:hypothetical protein